MSGSKILTCSIIMSIITLHIKVIVDHTYFQDSCRSDFSNIFVCSNNIYTKKLFFKSIHEIIFILTKHILISYLNTYMNT